MGVIGEGAVHVRWSAEPRRGRIAKMLKFDIKATIDLILRVTTLLGGAWAVWTFWRTTTIRRAEWLSSVHAKFFESLNYKTIRRVLDYETEPEFSRLRQAVVDDAYDELVEALVDYLNFFEFVASLERLGQIKSKEVSILFQYYLTLLCKHDFVRGFIRTQGFEGLQSLLAKCVSDLELK